jgi:hypothetical protein
MSQDESSGPDLDLSGPDLAGVVADAVAVGLRFVVIGGFSVIANGFLRATDDSDLLVPDDPENDDAIVRFLDRIKAARLRDGRKLTLDEIANVDHVRVNSRHGVVDVMRGGLPPLDYDTVAGGAMSIDIGGHPTLVAGLRSIVGFKRLADRPRDRNDLMELEAFHGELPVEPIPGVDTDA